MHQTALCSAITVKEYLGVLGFWISGCVFFKISHLNKNLNNVTEYLLNQSKQ